ncbi:MAG: YXWGXW repeat-containing protein [Chitinophagaceae bacterium]|nr:YXWGXW repeat-containing protein [Chitinophagaceae bacterium]
MKKYFLHAVFILTTAFILGSCSPSGVIVTTRPAPPRYERPVAPGPAYVWVNGDWIRRNGQYVWREGYWTPRQRNHNEWVEGHWNARRGGWYWIPGHWRQG